MNNFTQQQGAASPCKGCAARSLGCHAGCNGYKEWHESTVKVKKARNRWEIEGVVIREEVREKYKEWKEKHE